MMQLVFVLVFFPPDVADPAGPPTRLPMANRRNGVLQAAPEALGLRFDRYRFRF